jgi:L-aspartate semialdehyde sulfurtransferase ferredoxin
MAVISRRLVLRFPQRLVERPMVSKLVKDYGLDFNIIKATVSPGEEGLLVMELSGEKKSYEEGVKYLTDAGVKLQPLSQDVTRNESRCTHCGACVTICPSSAFSVDAETRKVTFDNAKCVVCELCIRACPPRAMDLHF